MRDSEFLQWIANRIVYVYGESPNVDFIHRLRAIALQTKVKEQDEDRCMLYEHKYDKEAQRLYEDQLTDALNGRR